MNALAITEAELIAAPSPVRGLQQVERTFAPFIATGRDSRVRSLRRSPLLLHISAQTVVVANELYARAPLRRTINGTQWCFRWKCVTGPLAGVLLRLKIGAARLTVGIDDLGPFDASDVMRPELPPMLRVAYLSGAGAALWRELEGLTRCAVELMDVQYDSAMAVSTDCVGFELGSDPSGPSVRGFVCPDDEESQRTLFEASRREMARARLPANIPIRWTAIVGNTMLPAVEVRALETGDIVVIDDAVYTADTLGCWLGAGVSRRYAGRVQLRHGQLHLVEFATKGNATMQMTSPETDKALAEEAGFGEIQVSLRFELAQWQAPLQEVAALAAGTVIDLGRSINEQLVSLWAEQRCIGKGQLVAIGDRLGVRLLTVFGGGNASVSQNSRPEAAVPPQAGSQSDAAQPEFSTAEPVVAERSG